MSTHDPIDPQSKEALDALLAVVPGGFNAIPDLVERRATLDGMVQALLASLPPHPAVVIEDDEIPGPDGGPSLRVRIYRPTRPAPSRPMLLFLHGGGMVLGNLDSDQAAALQLCERVGAVLVSPDYRLAPEHPYPAAPEDCYATLSWMAAHAERLAADPGCLGVYGASAGGNLALAVCLMARDRGGPAVRFMMPIYPMLDDRNTTPSSHAITDVGVWDRSGNIEAWGWYLAGRPADAYAAPARATELGGLPPAFIDIGTVDLFRDEAIAFAHRLMLAGVPTDLRVHAGAYHGSEVLAPDAELSQRIWDARVVALRNALA